jgi:poly(A) polymerase
LNDIFHDDPVRMIRAVKYSAAAGFKLPLFLKWRIRNQSHLLANVSPSRLTEEMFKIIHAASVVQIVEDLDTLGLYGYLQPHAAQLMKEQSDFRKRYLDSLRTLTKEDFKAGPGEALMAFIRDYLEDAVSWATETSENYKDTFILARRFVLPMNPPRVELDRAVRLVYKAHGIIIKRSRLPDRAVPAERREAQPKLDTAKVEARKRPLRRRRKSSKAKVRVEEGELREQMTF